MRLDTREGALKGGDNGPALVPGEPDKSRLVEAARYQNADLQMPPKGKLSDAVISDLAAWVKAGAIWPGDAEGPKAGSGSFDLAKRKQDHWAWRPVAATDPPAVRDVGWATGPVDRFILAKLDGKGIRPAPPAERRVWLRRVYFDLVGLPPSPAELAAYLADTSPDADAHGGGPAARLAPLRRAVGPALARPGPLRRDSRARVRLPLCRMPASTATTSSGRSTRTCPTTSSSGSTSPATWCRTRAGTRPTGPTSRSWGRASGSSARRCTRRWTSAKIRPTGSTTGSTCLRKAFCGLTVACARCHDHKFDAISTKDYYALFGLAEGAGYRQVRFDTLEHNRKVAAELDDLNDRFAKDLAAAVARRADASVLAEVPITPKPAALPAGTEVVVDYAAGRPEQWLPDDASFGTRPRRVGDLVVENDVVQFVEMPAAVYDRAWDVLTVPPGTESEHGVLGKRIRAGRSIRTPAFQVRGKVHYLVKGGGTAYAAVDEHTLIAGPLHGALVMDFPAGAGFRWVTHDLTPYQGQHAHVEFTAGNDSDFAVAMVVQGSAAPPAPTVDAQTHSANQYLVHAAGDVKKTAADFRAARAQVTPKIRPTSRLAPATWEGTGVDEHVFIRGSPKGLGERVPRRFLEALGGNGPITTGPGSGRLELARTMTDRRRTRSSPASRSTASGTTCSAAGIVGVGRQLRRARRGADAPGAARPPGRPLRPGRLVAQAARPRAGAVAAPTGCRPRATPEADRGRPAELAAAPRAVRRLEGEAIRDAMLAVSGRLDRAACRAAGAGPPDAVPGGPRPAGEERPARRRRPAQSST